MLYTWKILNPDRKTSSSFIFQFFFHCRNWTVHLMKLQCLNQMNLWKAWDHTPNMHFEKANCRMLVCKEVQINSILNSIYLFLSSILYKTWKSELFITNRNNCRLDMLLFCMCIVCSYMEVGRFSRNCTHVITCI